MAVLTIRNVDASTEERLRARAAEHGHSMEAEAGAILKSALAQPNHPPAANLYNRIHARFASIGGVDLELPPRQPTRDPPQLD